MASSTRKRRRTRRSGPIPIGGGDVDSGDHNAVDDDSPEEAVVIDDDEALDEADELDPDDIDDDAIVESADVVTDGDIVGSEARMRRLPPTASPVGGAARPPRSQLSSGFTPHAVGAADGPEPEPPLIAPPAPRRQISSEDYAVSVSAGATPEQVFARRLAVHVVSAIEDSNARKILVTSPNRGDGKTRFVQLIKPEMPNISTMSYLVLDMSQLVSTDPRMIPDDVLVLVDGPAMLEGDGILRIPDDWMAALDGSIVVVMGRDTTRSALEDTVSFLDASDLPAVGVIYNEAQAPPLRQRMRNIEARFVDPDTRRLRNPFKRRSS